MQEEEFQREWRVHIPAWSRSWWLVGCRRFSRGKRTTDNTSFCCRKLCLWVKRAQGSKHGPCIVKYHVALFQNDIEDLYGHTCCDWLEFMRLNVDLNFLIFLPLQINDQDNIILSFRQRTIEIIHIPKSQHIAHSKQITSSIGSTFNTSAKAFT